MPKYNVRINNDKQLFDLKIKLRQEVVDVIESPNVLDCYAGQGLLWKELIKNNSKKITTFSIDRIAKNKPDWLGNNINFLRTKDLSQYNIIDLDAWGSPVKQLEIIFKRKFTGYVIVTFISTIAINPDATIANSYGLTKEIIKESPSVVGGKIMEMFFQWLKKQGVDKIRVCGTAKKNICGFISIIY